MYYRKYLHTIFDMTKMVAKTKLRYITSNRDARFKENNHEILCQQRTSIKVHVEQNCDCWFRGNWRSDVESEASKANWIHSCISAGWRAIKIEGLLL